VSAPSRLAADGRPGWAPRIGWPASALLVLAVWAACTGIVGADWVEGDIALFYVGAVALLVGAALVASPLSGRRAAPVAGLSGLFFVAQLVARPIPPLHELCRWFGSLFAWLWQRASGILSPPPDLSLWAGSLKRWAALLERLAAWVASLFGGPSTHNPAAFLLVSGTLLWSSVAWAIWWTARRGRPLLAMLPLGLALSASTYLAGAPLGWVLAFALCLAMLLPVVHLRLQEARWERESVDYSPEIGFDVWQVAFLVAVAVLLLTLLTPNLQLPRLVSSFWKRIEPARQAVSDGLARFFGGVEPRDPPQLTATGGTGTGEIGLPGTLPRAHLLTGGPRLLRQRVMTVCTDAPPPAREESPLEERLVGPNYYWRGITYDTFDGRSWGNGPYYRDELLPNEPVQDGLPSETHSLRQRYRVERGEGGVLFAAAEPLSVDQPLVRWQRAPGDLVGLRGTAREYVVRSGVPQPSAVRLRAAPARYPESVRSRYLALREDTPAALRELALDVAGGAPTPYDAALALQRYLRQFEYDLDVPAPPPGQDAVAYFLFDLQRGYCDYYASAFVVLARAAGLPARLAVGYATGEYDPDQGCYQVRELDGHSWPEVYFAGYGWVPFEPTAAFEPLERSMADAAPSAPAAHAPAPPRRSPRQVARAWWHRAGHGTAIYLFGAGLTALLVAVAAVGYRIRWRRRLPPVKAVALCYGEMARLGGRLGARRQSSHTAREYAGLLSSALHARVARAPWGERALAAILHEATWRIHTLSEAYARASYGVAPPTDADRARAQDTWRRLRRQMWSLRVLSAQPR
jgi:transglutaminase-like putative cysteine protease